MVASFRYCECMGPGDSHQLVEVLRATIRDLERDPGITSPEDVAALERIILRWIAEAERADIQPAPAVAPIHENASVADSSLALALNLASALVADPEDDDSVAH